MATPQKPSNDPWEQEAANFKASGTPSSASAPNDDWKIWQSGNESAPPTTMLQKAMAGAKDVAKGVGEGLIHTGTSLSPLLNKIPGIGETLAPSSGIKAAKELERPTNTAQTIGKTGEQIGEWLLPTGAESKVGGLVAEHAPQIARWAVPAAKIATASLESGVRNKLQGGDFKTGAEAGAIGGGIGMGLKTLAPKVAESALNVRKMDRAYGRTPGSAILDETRGFRPETIANSAQERLGELNPQLEHAYMNAPGNASLGPARTVISDAMDKATMRGEPSTIAQLSPMESHLTANRVTGMPHVPQVSTNLAPNEIKPIDLLNIKRGFGNEFVHNWNPETMKGVKSTAAQGYHALDAAGDAAVPESADLNSRISSLIPVAKRAESAQLNAPMSQRVLDRMKARTGALAGMLGGGYAGYREKGVPGMMAGGAAGLVLPELIASPTAEMMGARALNNPGMIVAPAKGAALQFDREKKENK